MIRLGKKVKINEDTRCSTVYSGSFMTSYLHDDELNEFNNDMPIASPDSLNNDLGVDDKYQNEEDMEARNVTKSATQQLSANRNECVNTETESIKAITKDSNSHKKNSLQKQRSLSQYKAISGGLTLNKSNKSLKNLIFYIKTAYSNNLTSPKWKNFKGLKLQVVEKIRLNNAIWRTWFEQYGSKSMNKKKPPLLLAINVDDQVAHKTNPRAAVIEGEYWKRRLGSITNEYKKWRTVSRQHVSKLKGETDVNNNTNSMQDKNNLIMNQIKTNVNSQNTSISYYNNFTNANNGFVDYSSIGNTGLGATYNQNNNEYCNANNMGYINTNQINNSTFYDNANNNQYENSSLLNSSASFTNSGSANNQANHNTNFVFSQDQPQVINGSAGAHVNTPSVSNYPHPPISSKQVPFTNRCRSPSPGLFNDIDMFNFSSDTLFGTNYLEDHKDPIFGNNPDLFQPDLMHLYPNFDFLDLDYNDGIGSNTSHSNTMQSTNSNSSNLNPCSQIPDTAPRSNNSNSNDYVPAKANQQQINFDNYKNNNNNNNNNPNKTVRNETAINVANNNQVALLNPNQSQASYEMMRDQVTNPENTDLYNFNTLVSAAAALPNLSQNFTSNNISRNEINGAGHTDINNNDENDQIQKGPNLMSNNQHNKNGPKNGRKLVNEYSNNSNNIGNSNDNITSNQKMKNMKLPLEQSVFNSKIPNQQYTSPTNDLNHSNNDLQASMNGSSNTIRNLLAQQSPHAMPINEGMNQIQNNIRTSGVYSISNNPTQLFQPQQKQQPMYSSPSSFNTLLPNVQAANTKPPVSNLKPNNQIQDSNNTNKYKNEQISSLLSVVLAPSLDSAQSNENTSKEQTVISPQKKMKRTRKASTKYINEMGSFNGKDLEHQEPQIKKSTKPKKQNPGLNHDADQNKHQIGSDYMNDFLNQPKIMLSDMSHDQSSNLTSSPIGLKSSTNYNGNLQNSSDSYSRFNSVNSESGEIMSGQSHTHLRQSSNNMIVVEDSITPISRSRSSSINNTTISNEQGMTTAEQKRRCNIQYGFDRLQTLVPALKDSKNSKASKATMLKKTADYIKELQTARDARMADLAAYQREIESLSNKVTECQIQLPANGVSVTKSLNKTEVFEKKFRTYVQEKTVENWKFYLFSAIIKPLYDNFVTTLNTSSREDMERTFYEWQDKYCNLVQLRPLVSNYLRQISKSTSILTDASKVPEECYVAALTKT